VVERAKAQAADVAVSEIVEHLQRFYDPRARS
jgi:hypothetical protein